MVFEFPVQEKTTILDDLTMVIEAKYPEHVEFFTTVTMRVVKSMAVIENIYLGLEWMICRIALDRKFRACMFHYLRLGVEKKESERGRLSLESIIRGTFNWKESWKSLNQKN